ncbi:MAG: hypothetical protein KGM44_04170 [bacterium]|nr:hypothetical protein [bacterium]
MSEALIYVVFAIGIVLPMAAGLIELAARRDDAALPVDESYSRDPRYLGKSLREKAQLLTKKAPVGVRVPYLARKQEFARVMDRLDLPNRGRFEDVVLARGPVVVGRDAALLDVYAEAGASLGANVRLRTLAADGDASVGEGVSMERWADVEGNFTIGGDADLGRSACASQALIIGVNSRFLRLFGRPVTVGAPADAAAAAGPTAERVPMLSSGDREIAVSTNELAAGETLIGDIICTNSVQLGPNSTIRGCVKSDRDITVGEGARVYGNLVAHGSILLGRGSIVFGHLFAEESLSIASGAIVGSAELPKTAYGGASIELEAGARIYGWAITEGDGATVAAGA